MAHFSSISRRWEFGFVAFALLYLLLLCPQTHSASNSVSTETKGAELERRLPIQTSSHSSPAVESIEDLFKQYPNKLGRLHAAYDLIGDADEAKLVNLFDQVSTRKYSDENGSWKSQLLSLISTQLSSKNLDKTISLFEAQPLEDAKYMVYPIMNAWATKDFEGAIAFARKQHASVHSDALRGIVDASLSLPEITLKDLGREFGDVEYVERALAARQMELDLTDPDTAWADLINDPTIHREENFDRVKNVANALIDKYGAAEAEKLLDAIKGPTLRFGLSKSILTKIAFTEPEVAFNIAIDQSNDLFGTMLATVVDTWASTDPKSALTRVQSLMPSRLRDRLEQTIVSSWVLLHPKQFKDSFDGIPIELHDVARLSLVQMLTKDSLEDALAVLAEITDLTTQEEAVSTIVDSWIDSDPDAVFNWIASSPEIGPYRNRLLFSFLEQLTDSDADKAFELALSQPIKEETGIGLEATIIDNLKFSDTDLALGLLKRVRLGKTQLAAFDSVSTGLIYDHRSNEAIELGKRLADTEQINYYNNLALDIVIHEPPKKLLEIIPNIPVKQAQSKIAENALLYSPFSDDKDPLPDEDVQALLEFVDAADLKRINFFLQKANER